MYEKEFRLNSSRHRVDITESSSTLPTWIFNFGPYGQLRAVRENTSIMQEYATFRVCFFICKKYFFNFLLNMSVRPWAPWGTWYIYFVVPKMLQIKNYNFPRRIQIPVTDAETVLPQLSTCQTRKVASGDILKVTISAKVFNFVFPILMSLVVNSLPLDVVTTQWKSSSTKLLRTCKIMFPPNIGRLVEVVIWSWGCKIRIELIKYSFKLVWINASQESKYIIYLIFLPLKLLVKQIEESAG